jgi:L-alanine-DL-glutamate epimerase-like enolase superfamily enzyme
MKITDVQAILMSYPMPQPLVLPFYNGRRTILKRDAMLIKVVTDTGLIGYAPGPAHERAATTINDVIRPILIGKDPLEFSDIEFAAFTNDAEALNLFLTVEQGLSDIAGKFNGASISEMTGFRKRDRIKLYGSAGMYMSPEGYAAEADAIAQLGFRAYKMRPALGPDRDLRTVELMRKAVGPDVGLMVDAHSWWRMGDKSYSLETVTELACAFEQFNLTWLEEPLPPDDHDAYRALKMRTKTPIATGEHEHTYDGFIDLIKSRAADYLQMDVCCQGGLVCMLDEIQTARLKFAFHSWGTALEALSAAHLGVCWPESVVEWLEYPCYANEGRVGMYPFPLADEILVEPLRIENGELVVPRGPGLGIDIDERVIEKYPFIPGPWSFFQIDSPAETIAVTGDHSVKWEPVIK